MIGSGNPQEGELRPQLLDRFGLSVQVDTILDLDIRTQMVLDRIAYDKDPDAFCAGAEGEQEALRATLDAARDRLGKVWVGRGVGDLGTVGEGGLGCWYSGVHACVVGNGVVGNVVVGNGVVGSGVVGNGVVGNGVV